MQNEMEQVQKELLTNKVTAIWPKPRARKAIKPVVGSSGDCHTDSMMEADETDNCQEAVKNMDNRTASGKKRAMKKGEKPLIKDTISNIQKKISKPSKVKGDNTNNMAHGSDEKDSTASTAATLDAQTSIWIPVATKIPDAEALIGSFADDNLDDTLKCEATIAVASIFEDNLDFNEPKAPFTQIPPPVYDLDDEFVTSFTQEERYSWRPEAPFTQMDNHMAMGALKQKASVEDVDDIDEESLVSDWSMDIDCPDFEDLIMNSDEALQLEPAVAKKVLHTMSLTSVSVVTSIADSKPPAQKKAKVKSSTTPAHGAPTTKCQLNVDTVSKHIKPCSIYHNVDLPATMQVDQCWAKKFIPTIMLWAGSYKDIWSIPDDVLLLHAQLVFDVVYKELNITIVHGDCTVYFQMAQLAFLFEDPDSPSPLTAYCSPFVLQLLGTVHLNAISGELSGVLAISAAAMFTCKDLKVKDVLVSASRGKLAIKLLKVLNKATRKMTNTPFLFSAAQWAKATN
ncbi:hypothetical protein DFH29DRAFT_877974 [Suillus ampliporus]|nr:hypothetical protein DFH29DRAFT_877974 [Suillus ampliporus]